MHQQGLRLGCDAGRESRDPRFDSLSGTLDNDRFRKRYAFLYDEQLPAERDEIKASLQVQESLPPPAHSHVQQLHGASLKWQVTWLHRNASALFGGVLLRLTKQFCRTAEDEERRAKEGASGRANPGAAAN